MKRMTSHPENLIGLQATINKYCFIEKWVGRTGTIISYEGYVGGIGFSFVLRTHCGDLTVATTWVAT